MIGPRAGHRATGATGERQAEVRQATHVRQVTHIRQVTGERQATHVRQVTGERQATRKGWPYYTRSGPSSRI